MLAHKYFYHLGIEKEKVWVADPYNAPCMDFIFDDTFLALTTKAALYDPPRPIPPDAMNDVMKMVEEMCRSGISDGRAASLDRTPHRV